MVRHNTSYNRWEYSLQAYQQLVEEYCSIFPKVIQALTYRKGGKHMMLAAVMDTSNRRGAVLALEIQSWRAQKQIYLILNKYILSDLVPILLI